MANGNTVHIEVTANADKLKRGLANADKSLKGFKSSAAQVTKTTAKMGKTVQANAVPALTSFSQVIQDAPYGIRGVANNITQLTSQFGYLSKSTGGAKAALSSMLGALTGPAGILFAVSAVTSLLVSYGDEISEFVFGTDDATVSTQKLNDALREQVNLRKLLKDELSIATSIAVAEAKLAGKSAEEQYKVRKDFALAEIEVLKGSLKESQNIRDKALSLSRLKENQSNEEVQQATKDARKNVLDIEKALSDAKAKLRLDDLNEQIRIQENAKKNTIKGVNSTKSAVVSALQTSQAEITPIANAITDTILNVIPQSEIITAKTSMMLAALHDFNAKASDIIRGGISNTFADLGYVIGDALATGGNVLNAAGSALLGSLGGILVQMGEMAISIGVGMLGIKAALKSLNPAVAIAAGVALVALGSFFGSKSKSIGGGIGGGGASDSGAGGSSFRGSSTSSSGFSGSGGGTYVFEIAGTKLVGVLKNTLDRNKALGGSLSLTT